MNFILNSKNIFTGFGHFSSDEKLSWLAARLLDLLRRRVDGARQFGVLLRGLCAHHNVGPVRGQFEGDLLANATGGARDQDGAAEEFSGIFFI